MSYSQRSRVAVLVVSDGRGLIFNVTLTDGFPFSVRCERINVDQEVWGAESPLAYDLTARYLGEMLPRTRRVWMDTVLCPTWEIRQRAHLSSIYLQSYCAV